MYVLVKIKVGAGEIARLEVGRIARVVGFLAALLERVPVPVEAIHNIDYDYQSVR